MLSGSIYYGSYFKFVFSVFNYYYEIPHILFLAFLTYLKTPNYKLCN